MRKKFFLCIIIAFLCMIQAAVPSLAEQEKPGSSVIAMERLPEAEEPAEQVQTENGEGIPGEPLFAEEEMGPVMHVRFPDSVDEESLAESFIMSSLPGRRRVLRVSRPSGLAEFAEGTPDRTLYLALMEQITKVAGGEETSTVFDVPAENLLSPAYLSAEDLTGDLLDADGNLTEEAKAAINSMIVNTVHISRVVSCLMADCPFHLYWFAKSYATTYTRKIENDRVTIVDIRIRFHVSQDYADLTDWDGTSKLTRMDTEKYGTVRNAAANIQEILSETAGMDDYSKICSYAERICELASYNNEAIRQQLPYGDPWQLIWVFDENPDTKVVCEGYTKAFTYLCDLGTAEATAISCQGYLNQRTAANAHMWNVVTLEGRNYLVDLTNYDLGLDLFMVGYADGSVSAGYTTRSGQKYYYNRTYTPRSDGELTLSRYSYEVWKAAISAAPEVTLSSTEVYPGYSVAIRLHTELPADRFVMIRDQESEELPTENGIAVLSPEEDTELRFAAVIDGTATPETETLRITVPPKPEGLEFAPPPGAEIEEDAFAGTAASVVQLKSNTVKAGAFTDCPNLKYVQVAGETDIAPGAFDGSVLLLVEETGGWFDSGYSFMVAREESPEE